MQWKHEVIRATVRTATAYHFNFKPHGWAIFTINDGTGELSVQSDWGNFAYRWSADPAHLGHPTLTDFLRDRASTDYLTDKLTYDNRAKLKEVDEEASLADIRGLIVKLRRERGDLESREYSAYHGEFRTDLHEVDKQLARSLWDEADSFLRNLPGRDMHDAIGDQSFEFRALLGEEPWYHLHYRDSRCVEVLRDVLLPALIDHLNAKPPTLGAATWVKPADVEAVAP